MDGYSRGRLLRDACLVGFFLVLSVVLIFVIRSGEGTGSKVVVAVEGVEVCSYPLSVDGRYVLNGGSNVLCIEDGSARMVDANCPDKLCVKQGAVKYTNQCITCLPNRLTVTVVGGDDSVEIVL